MPRSRRINWHKHRGRWFFTRVMPAGRRVFYYADPSIPRTESGRRAATAWMNGLEKELESAPAAQAEAQFDLAQVTVDMLRLLYLDRSLAAVTSGAASRHTYTGHRKQLSQVCRAVVDGRPFGEREAATLTARDLARLEACWAGKGPTTIRNRLASLQAMLNWAAEDRSDRPVPRLITTNPVADYAAPRVPYRGDRYAPAEEVDAFLAWLDRRAGQARGWTGRFDRMTALMVRLIAETGCRPGEACAVRWEHHLPAERAFVLPPDLHKTGRKTGRPRLILLTPGLAEAVGRLRDDPDAHPEFVFTHKVGPRDAALPEAERRRGTPWDSNAFSRKVKVLRREAIAAGLPLADSGVRRMHAYRLRHSRITASIQRGIDIADVAGMSGNSIAVIEKTYLHHQLGHLREALDRAASPGGPANGDPRSSPGPAASRPDDGGAE